MSKSIGGEFTRLTSENIDAIVGKKLIAPDGEFIVLGKDGSISGIWGKVPVNGTWEMKDDLWCRTYSEIYVDSVVSVSECHLWEQSENRIRGTRDRGNGSNYTFSFSL